MNSVLRAVAVLVTTILTFVCQNSAAMNMWFPWLPDATPTPAECEDRLATFQKLFSGYDKKTWLNYVDEVARDSQLNTLARRADLIAGMPNDLRGVLLSDIASRRMRKSGNKRSLDLMFNLIDRGDKVYDCLDTCSAEDAYRTYFARDAAYFKPAYDATLVLTVLKKIQAALPAGSSVAVGGSFTNARTDIKRWDWDIDLLGELKVKEIDQVKAAIEAEFRSRGLTPPKVHYSVTPKSFLHESNITFFDVEGGEGSIWLWISPPPLPIPSASGYSSWKDQGSPRKVPL